MGLLTTDQLALFLVFVVPGFVAMKTHDLLIPAEPRHWGSSLVEAVSYSMLNLALLFWAVALLHREGFQQAHPVGYFVGMFGVLFLAPAVWAILARYLRSSQWLRRIVTDPSPTSWDFFLAQRRPGWVLFHLKSGEKLGGRIGEKSFSSAHPYTPDIYVEEVWRLDEQHRFSERIPQTAGALVTRDECTHIEFFTLESRPMSKPEGSKNDQRISKMVSPESGSDLGGYRPSAQAGPRGGEDKSGYRPTASPSATPSPPRGGSGTTPAPSVGGGSGGSSGSSSGK